MVELWLELAALAGLIGLSGFFSGLEVALVGIRKSKVIQLFNEGRKGSKALHKLKMNPSWMMSSVNLGNNLVNVAASALLTSMAIQMFDSFAIGIATGVMTLLILVFGEITPKSIAAQNNQIVSQLVAPIIWYLSMVLAPVLNILDLFLNRFIKVIGIKSKQKAISEEEIRTIVTAASEEGSIHELEKNLINRVFEFDNMSVDEIATPRTDMVMISNNSKISDVMKLMLKTNYSRIPVYQKSRDNIVGMVYVKDVIKYVTSKKSNMSISKISSKPYFIPESKKVSSLLRQFQKRSEHMAIVVDEHGSITGLVTLEDVLEEIVGEIMDETDKIDPDIKKLSRNAWLVKGKADIDKVNSQLKMVLAEDDYDTFSGFILKQTGKIPKENEQFTYKNFRITIVERDKHRISEVKVEKI